MTVVKGVIESVEVATGVVMTGGNVRGGNVNGGRVKGVVNGNGCVVVPALDVVGRCVVAVPTCVNDGDVSIPLGIGRQL